MERFEEGYCRSADGTAIYWSVRGPAGGTPEPDLVLCDGLGCDGFIWKYLIPAFSDRHRIVRFHYRAHGRSETPTDLSRLSMAALVDDLFAAMDAARSERAVLAGHSMGVQVILEAHRRHPNRVRALVPICGSYGHPLDTFHGTDALRSALPYIHRLVTAVPRAVLTVWSTLLPSPVAYFVALLAGEVNRSLIRIEDLQPYFDHLARMDPRVFVTLLEAVSKHSAEDHLPHVDVPTLVIGAEHDSFTPVWLSRRMAECIPGAELLIVPKGSHAAPLEQPELVALRLEKFLRERLGCYAPALSSGSPSPSASVGEASSPEAVPSDGSSGEGASRNASSRDASSAEADDASTTGTLSPAPSRRDAGASASSSTGRAG
ncbi:MAG: alpha/beta hydrolase [Deltaproteobacteria bacterium]|nr:MAG: alpha/beta hydrolase [Deltaproteobacteria bacterium]